MVEQAPLKRKVTGSSPVWPTLLLILPGLALAKHAVKAPKAPAMVEVSKGTILAVELVDPVSSGKNKAGDTFRARLEEGIYVHGKMAAPPGTLIRGKVTEAVPSGRVKGQSRLALTLESLHIDGSTYTFRTETLSYIGEPHAGKNWGSSLMGALQGALYGVLFGGHKGAVIGAGAGAAAGAAGSVITGKAEVEYKQGAKLMFETTEPFSVPELPAAQAQSTAAPPAISTGTTTTPPAISTGTTSTSANISTGAAPSPHLEIHKDKY